MTAQTRGKVATYAAIFWFAATIPPVSATTLSPASFTIVLCTSPSDCSNPNTGTSNSGAPPTSPNATATFGDNATPHGEAQIIGSPTPNPEIVAAANATGLNADARANILYQYFFKVVGPSGDVPITVHASLSVGGSSSGGGAPWSSIANISIDGHLVESITANSIDHISPTLLNLTKTNTVSANTAYLVSLFVDAHAQASSGSTSNTSAWIDPWITTDVLGESIIVSDFIGNIATTPLPAALPLFASGLGALGLVGWRRKRKASAALAA